MPSVLIILDAPSADDAYFGSLLSHEQGRLMRGALERCGLGETDWSVTSLSAVPVHGSEHLGAWAGLNWQTLAERVLATIKAARPNIILCLGDAAWHLLKDGCLPQRYWTSPASEWRGTVLWSEWAGCKVMTTWHPRQVQVDFSLQGFWRASGKVGDLVRLKAESQQPELEPLPPDNMLLVTEPATLERWLEQPMSAVSLDIEGRPGNVTSIAFATTANSCIVVPFAHVDGSSVWSIDEEVRLWEMIRGLLEKPAVTKIVQNGSYDFFALAWTYGLCPDGPLHDTMELWWELFAELPKSLATQTSLLTRRPFYKPDREEGELVYRDDMHFWTYNGMDAMVTFEIWQKASAMLRPEQLRHFEFNSSLFYAKLYLMLRGVKVDKKAVKEVIRKTEQEILHYQEMIDREAVRGDGMKDKERVERLRMIYEQ